MTIRPPIVVKTILLTAMISVWFPSKKVIKRTKSSINKTLAIYIKLKKKMKNRKNNKIDNWSQKNSGSK